MEKENSKIKNVPIRTCIATKVRKPKNELIRLVLDPVQNTVVVDLRSKIRARGANLDMTEKAFDIMQKARALVRALKLEKDLSLEEYVELKKKFLEAIEEKHFRPSNKPVKIRVKKEELV